MPRPSRPDKTPLSRDESLRLAGLAQAGDLAARDRLVASCDRLAITFARKYSSSAPHLVDDLIAEARLALIEAVASFEPDREGASSFATYAPFLIRNRLRETLQRQASAVTLPISRVGPVIRKRIRVTSIVQVNEDGSESVMEFPVEPEVPDTMLRDHLRAASVVLGLQECDVVEAVFVRDESFRQIADRYRVSRQRIEQVFAKALAKLRLRMLSDCQARVRKKPARKRALRAVPPNKPGRIADAVAELRERKRVAGR